MSTRGTYQFNSGHNHEGITTVYIHHDNYPKGAARYFYETLINPSKGNLATQFIRANPNSEITDSHEPYAKPYIHGDTKYQYYIDGNDAGAIVSVYEVDLKLMGQEGIPKKELCLLDSLPLYEFINKYIDDSEIEIIVPVSFNEIPHECTIYLNKELARKELARKGLPDEVKKVIRNYIGDIGKSKFFETVCIVPNMIVLVAPTGESIDIRIRDEKLLIMVNTDSPENPSSYTEEWERNKYQTNPKDKIYYQRISLPCSKRES
jgi:hypothetical protein